MSVMQPDRYWEARAQRFASEGAGLRAVCSYGMPWYYNWTIHWSQRLALSPWLRVAEGTRVLDVGCGVGRWSRYLAARGAMVAGVDLAPTMVREAEARAARAGLGSRCRFVASDLRDLDLDETFPLIVGVTVLQHILDDRDLKAVVANVARHLDRNGRVVLLEAASERPNSRCDTTTFRARTASGYLSVFAAAGLVPVAVTGVDPAPFKTLLLPHYRGLPSLVAQGLLAGATLAGAPIDLLFGRRLTTMSWHKVFVLEKAS